MRWARKWRWISPPPELDRSSSGGFGSSPARGRTRSGRQTHPLKEFVPTRRPDGHEEYYSSLWELGGLSKEALAKDWLPNAKS